MSTMPGKVTRVETLPSDPTDNPALEFRICVLRCVYFGLLVRFPFFSFFFASALAPTTVLRLLLLLYNRVLVLAT